jgi:protein involved in polysaccharide export with SLBB domain
MDLIDMAGGLTPQSYLKRVQVIRPKPNAERDVMDLDLTASEGNGNSPTNIELRNGDLVRIYPADPRVYNTVTLAGNVKYAGEYEYKPNMRLSHLLHQGSVLPEAYLEGVEIVRFKPDLTTEVIHANLKRAWAGDGSQDVVLQQRDQITVRSEFQAHRTVTLRGEVKLPGTYVIRPGERLSSVIQRAGGFTDKAFLKAAVFTRRSVEEMEKKNLDELMRRQEERFLIQNRPGTLQTVSMQEDEGRQSRWEQTRDELRVIASKVTLGRIVIRLDAPEKFEGSASDLILEEGDSFVVPQKPSAVVVLGSVRNPTAMLYEEGRDVLYYLNRAGGLSEMAEKKEMFLLKADGSALAGFLRVRNVEPGDTILVPPKSQERNFGWLKDIAAIAGQGLLGVAALAAIF